MSESVSAAPVYQRYILYRTTPMTYQPPSYVDQSGKTIEPPAIVAEPQGFVVSAQLLDGLTDVVVPAGFAYALDESSVYAVGSVYTPAAS